MALWLAFSIHITSFFLLLLHFIYLGFILRKLGRLLSLFYFYLVGAMIAVQYVFFQNGGDSTSLSPPVNCFKHSPGMYSWLVVQIVVFYGLVAYGIALCGAYICWEADVEERQLKKAVNDYIKMKREERKQGASAALMDDDDKSEPLLRGRGVVEERNVFVQKGRKPRSDVGEEEEEKEQP